MKKNKSLEAVRERERERELHFNEVKGITLIALIITIVLNCSSLAMERMYKKEKILKIN